MVVLDSSLHFGKENINSELFGFCVGARAQGAIYNDN